MPATDSRLISPKKVGAQRAVVAWVQMVNDLILNINVRISDIETGKGSRAAASIFAAMPTSPGNVGLNSCLKSTCSATGRSLSQAWP
jgi:hypothetical protein